jgi:transglutaminase-like putative cysteine protease
MNEPVELLQKPDWMLEEISKGFVVYGDCDDMAMLAAALLLAAGCDVRLVAVLAPDLSGNGHVYAEALDAGRGAWVKCDPTTGRPAPAGWLQLVEVV